MDAVVFVEDGQIAQLPGTSGPAFQQCRERQPVDARAPELTTRPAVFSTAAGWRVAPGVG
ncbi:hypothetical protein OG245_37740 (plasmid) [Streptomyces sp. NBC_01116]|uniref:hypothetical protein n=1 Tax=Streptomyces TaxID=1883 RepID=UPI002F90D3CB